MTIIQGAVLGLVQGLGEFLPISSSGHLVLARLLMGIGSEDPAFKMLDILLHVGTLIPILIIFWKDWLDLIRHPIRNRTLLLLFLASLPTLAVYLIFDLDVFDNGWFLGVAFLITALELVCIDFVSARRKNASEKVGIPNALLMGLFQGLALLPGVSRSGSTITGGVASGLDRKTAAKFSFMMSAPAIAASLLVEGYHAYKEDLFSHLSPVPTLVGVIIAGVVGFFAIRFMLRIISHVPMSWFALYVAVIGLVYLTLQLTGNPLLPVFHAPQLTGMMESFRIG